MKEIKLKEFKGFSGSKIFLLQDDQKVFVRKQGNVQRNLERYQSLSNFCRVPEIYKVDNDTIDIEYIPGLDIKQYLKYKKIDSLIEFLYNTFTKFKQNVIEKDYTEIYERKLKWIEQSDLDISLSKLLKKLPAQLPQSLYHGDFTLENILFSTSSNQFYLIDPLTSDYDSYMFDLAKLRQDLESKWFVRSETKFLDVQLANIQDQVFSSLGIEEKNNYLLILMLLRVYPYCPTNSFEQQFIKREIKRLWK
jgi:tRNA A-37 threonylcarbamoyl transferase component Bud32